MIRLFHVYFPGRTIVLFLTEALLLGLGLALTMFFWVGRDAELVFGYEHGSLKVLIACLTCMLCMYYYDLYDSLVLWNRREAAFRLVQVLGTSCIVLALLFQLFPGLRLGSGPLLTWMVVAGVFLPIWRFLYLSLSKVPALSRPVLLLGGGALAEELVKAIGPRGDFGLELRGFVSVSGEAAPGIRCLGEVGELEELLEREHIQHIIIAMDDRRGKLPVDTLLAIKARGVRIDDGARTYEAITGRMALVALRPTTLLLADGFHVSRFTLLYKRFCSVFFSTIVLVLTLPVMLVTAVLIRLDSAGPALFRQKRVGLHGKVFELLKFRSMFENAEADAKPAEQQDKRCTRVGRWLRRTRIDELPQIYNILMGHMDLIGPRPFTVDMEADLVKRIPYYSQRWNIKPGATGWAQVQRGYCSTLEDNIEKLSYDLFYIKNVSVSLDWLILFQTIKILLLGRGGR